MNNAPTWPPAADAMRWLNEVETMQGGANGLTIKLRAAILAMGQPVSAEICQMPDGSAAFVELHRDAWADGRAG